MKVPNCRVNSIGEISNWGKQFLTSLESKHIIEVTYETSLQAFANSLQPSTRIPILMIENVPESRQSIQKLRASGRRFYLVWFGRIFTKEDLAFALEHRAFCVFEQARADEKKVSEGLLQLSHSLERAEHFEQMVHSLKALLIQAETDSAMQPVVAEIKTAVSKLERYGVHNDFVGAPAEVTSTKDAKLPFYKAQGFGDALTTVHNLERTGVLWVRGTLPDQEGKIEFLQGKIISGHAGELHGLKAIYRMFLWDEPRFLFTRQDPQNVVFEEQLEQSMKYLCLEGETLRRRFDKIRHELPPLDLALELEPSSLHVSTQLTSEDFSTLASIVEFGKVGMVLNYNPASDVHVYESLIRLKKHKLIRVAA